MLRIKEMPFLGTTNLEISRGGMPPDPPRGRAPEALGFTFTITIPIWNPPIQKSWLRRWPEWIVKKKEAREALVTVVSSQERHLRKNYSKQSVWGKFLARILVTYLSSQLAKFQPEERIIWGAAPLGTPDTTF